MEEQNKKDKQVKRETDDDDLIRFLFLKNGDPFYLSETDDELEYLEVRDYFNDVYEIENE
jgi:hypothetical protein